MKCSAVIFAGFFGILLFNCSPQNKDQVFYEATVGSYSVTITGEGELEAKSAQVLQTPQVRPAPTISYLIEEGSQVQKGDVVVQFTQTEIENDYLNALDELAAARADSVETEAELVLQLLLYESQLSAANASAEAARLQLARIKFEAPATQEIKRLEINQFEIEAEKARRNLESLQQIQQEERLNAQLRIRQAQNKVNSAKRQLNELTLTAPYAGIVVYEINRVTDEKVQEGNTLYPNMPVVQIPDLSRMQLKMYISETDAQKLALGMPAVVTVPSLAGASFSAKISRVERIAKAIRRNSQVRKVEVIVEIDSAAAELRPGLTAMAEVFIKQAKNVIPVPLETIFERDSVRVVYVRNSSGYEPRPVASLYQDEDFMLVYGNLRGGEALALHEPAYNRVKWPDSLLAPRIPAEADTFKVQPKAPPGAPEFPPDIEQRMRRFMPPSQAPTLN